LNYSNHNSW